MIVDSRHQHAGLQAATVAFVTSDGARGGSMRSAVDRPLCPCLAKSNYKPQGIRHAGASLHDARPKRLQQLLAYTPNLVKNAESNQPSHGVGTLTAGKNSLQSAPRCSLSKTTYRRSLCSSGTALLKQRLGGPTVQGGMAGSSACTASQTQSPRRWSD